MMDQRTAIRRHAAGELIYPQGFSAPGGGAWRVLAGSVRLDHGDASLPLLGGIALRGDVIGAETLLFERTSFAARAMSEVELLAWPDGAESLVPQRLLETLAGAEQRAAKVLALRCGQAASRVGRLLRLLAGNVPPGDVGRVQIAVPGLRDIADATDLTIETVSRVISRMRAAGLLQRSGRGRIELALEVDSFAEQSVQLQGVS